MVMVDVRKLQQQNEPSTAPWPPACFTTNGTLDIVRKGCKVLFQQLGTLADSALTTAVLPLLCCCRHRKGHRHHGKL